ncbi:uncharacterized protein LOC115041638 [Echeneis naucrates]|uniref:uncharacterized protein LOC115041638 n=1 Tax=Echeneis naucrates TaxID=173247 RepID=UPI001114220D|nr:uncharacterized protein LOC115041638 [Echeneis naucrates]
MAALSWMVVSLAVFLSTRKTSAVDPNDLAPIIQQLINRFRPSYIDQETRETVSPMYSVLVGIPFNTATRSYDINLVPDTGDAVRTAIQRCEIYSGRKVVAATVLQWRTVMGQCPNELVPPSWKRQLTQRHCPQGVRTWKDVDDQCADLIMKGKADHAEYRVLQGFSTISSKFRFNELLVFFTLSSPCSTSCTSETSQWSILDSIQGMRDWGNRAVVFSQIYKPSGGTRDLTPEERRGSLKRLGDRVGLRNIFYCRRVEIQVGQHEMVCSSCANPTGTAVKRECYDENAPPTFTQNTQGGSTRIESLGDGRVEIPGGGQAGGQRQTPGTSQVLDIMPQLVGVRPQVQVRWGVEVIQGLLGVCAQVLDIMPQLVGYVPRVQILLSAAEKMAALSWMVVSLAVFLSTGKTTAVDPNDLAPIIQQLINRYKPSYYNQDTREM